MPYIDLRYNQEGIAMIKTVCKKFAGATKRETEKAYLTCTGQRKIGHPPDERFEEIVSLGKHGLRVCPVTSIGVSTAPVMFGPNHPRIREATMRDTKVLRMKEQRIAIPREFYKMHKGCSPS